MCGVVGYFGEGLGAAPLHALLQSMRERGPDGEGVFHDGALHMGMRRLSIIDLSGGGQPLRSRNNTVVAFQNGEIYNFKQLRRELIASGYAFKTESDTEVLAHGYAAWSIEGLLRRVDGMFALAIYDRSARVLHLARDRMGEKPLYYSAAPGRFGYGSTLLAVAALPWISDGIDRVALDHYLALHYVPGRRTILSDVKQLLPGECLSVTLPELSIRRSRYYEPPLSAPRKVEDEELAAAVESAVVSRMVSDVPLGVFLSGGLDSSIIAANAARHQKEISTFSIGFGTPKHDESPYAAAVAQHIGSKHHGFLFDESAFVRLLPEVARSLDAPIGDQAMLPVYWLSREARQHVSVVLSGEGADEVFGGYGYYRPFAADGVSSRLNSTIDALLGNGCSAANEGRLLRDTPPETISGFPLLTTERERRELLGGAAEDDDSWERGTLAWLSCASCPLQQATAADVATWLPGDLLVKYDRMAMAHSLEGRAPFLAPEVVALGLNLYPQERVAATSKVALRRIASRYLPEEILQRPKQGFVLPMSRWIHQWYTAHEGAATYFQERPFPSLDQSKLIEIAAADLEKGLQRERLQFALMMLVEWWAAFCKRRAALTKQIVDGPAVEGPVPLESHINVDVSL